MLSVCSRGTKVQQSVVGRVWYVDVEEEVVSRKWQGTYTTVRSVTHASAHVTCSYSRSRKERCEGVCQSWVKQKQPSA